MVNQTIFLQSFENTSKKLDNNSLINGKKNQWITYFNIRIIT